MLTDSVVLAESVLPVFVKGRSDYFFFLSASLLICPSFILYFFLLLTLLAFALLLSLCGLV